MLKRRFGNKNIIKTALYQQLRDIEWAGAKLGDLRNTTESIDKVCNQLSALGEDMNYPSLTLLIHEKLSPGIINLEEYKRSNPNWNIDTMKEKIHELISLREAAYNISGCKSTNEKWHLNLTKQKPIQPNHPFVVATSKVSDMKKRFPCAFCNGDHFHVY